MTTITAFLLFSTLGASPIADQPVTLKEAEKLYTAQMAKEYRAFAKQKHLSDTDVENTIARWKFELTEREVKGLYDALKVQVFSVKGMAPTPDSLFRDTTYALYKKTFKELGMGSNYMTLGSLLLHNKQLVYSYQWGSGRLRSQIGILTIEKDQLKMIDSKGYVDSQIVLKLDKDKVSVTISKAPELGDSDWGSDVRGWVKVINGKPTVVDSAGKEIPFKVN